MTEKKSFDMPHETDIAWCPGCGNFPILNILKTALADLGYSPEQVVLVSGIGQAAKTPHYVKTHVFNGLHGRSLPAATAIKLSHPSLKVIAESGDGDTYGEGGNHFMHSIRRNPGVVNIVHNNMIYGLTKGQASPTSQKGLQTPVQVNGVVMEPFNPIAVAIALGASFVARANAGNVAQAIEIFKQALEWKHGYALIDVFQPCVVFNKINTYQWFSGNTYMLDDTSHDKADRLKAMELAFATDKMPLGVIYQDSTREPYESLIRSSDTPLYKQEFDEQAFSSLLKSFA
ncbi:MAG: thiamine pyrophosphate-dependent enzyme [Candidatus Moraniibacteriota bacterium]